MIEVEHPLLPMATGRHPVVIIDTSASVADHLFYVKAFGASKLSSCQLK